MGYVLETVLEMATTFFSVIPECWGCVVRSISHPPESNYALQELIYIFLGSIFFLRFFSPTFCCALSIKQSCWTSFLWVLRFITQPTSGGLTLGRMPLHCSIYQCFLGRNLPLYHLSNWSTCFLYTVINMHFWLLVHAKRQSHTVHCSSSFDYFCFILTEHSTYQSVCEVNYVQKFSGLRKKKSSHVQPTLIKYLNLYTTKSVEWMCMAFYSNAQKVHATDNKNKNRDTNLLDSLMHYCFMFAIFNPGLMS